MIAMVRSVGIREIADTGCKCTSARGEKEAFDIVMKYFCLDNNQQLKKIVLTITFPFH